MIRNYGLAALAMAAVAVLIISLPAPLRAAPDSISTSNVIYSPMSDDGYQIGDAAADKIGFHQKAPTIQRTDASQVAITDNTAGTVVDTFSAGTADFTFTVPVTLSQISTTMDVATAITPGYRFQILAVDWCTSQEVTTGSKAASLNVEIGTTNLTGGVLALTSANCADLGNAVYGTAVTAGGTGTATDAISIEAASVTAFAEGAGYVIIRMRNLDQADAWAGIADKWNEIRTTLVNKGLITGS